MAPSWVSLTIELSGAGIVLLAYWANATGRWSPTSRIYLGLNILGSILLGYIAVGVRRWGFVVLEVVWAGISLLGFWATDTTFPKKDLPMTDDRARLLELIRTLALSRGHFILASGKESSYYLDGRMVTLSAEGAALVGRLMLAQLAGRGVQAVGGLTMGADPIATAVSLTSFLNGDPIPAFIVRKEAKGHGTQKQVEGPLPQNARVAIVEDTVTTGGSPLQAIAAVEALGCTVVTVLALIDRGEGARERIEAAGYAYEPLFTIGDLEI